MNTELTSPIRFTFTKDERLKSKKLIDELFSTKLFVQNAVIRIYYKETKLDCAYKAQFAFTAPKRTFPHATDRNRIKRLLRESVRLQKHLIYQSLEEKNKQIIVLLSYQAKTVKDFNLIDESISKLLMKILDIV